MTYLGLETVSRDDSIGKHCCALFSSEEECASVTAKYIIYGLQNNHKFAYFYHTRTPEYIVQILEQHGISNCSQYIASGQLSFLNVEEVYIQNGSFEVDRTVQALERLVKEAVDEGYSRLRVLGEMSWVHPSYKVIGSHRIMEYETKVGHVFKNYPVDALCHYDLRKFDSAFMLSVLNTHPIAVVGTEEFDNIYYMPPSKYLEDDLPTSTLKHWISNLRERKIMDAKLQSRTQELLEANQKLQLEIEERKKMQSAKESAEAHTKAQRSFLRIMSHELRTPLNGIMSMSQLLLKTNLTSEQREYGNVIDVSSQHLLIVLSDMLDYTKLESGELKVDDAPFSVLNCVASTLDLLKKREKSSISISFTVAPNVPTNIYGDINRIRQILFNLVSNAIKFTTDPNGSVEIRVNRKESVDGLVQLVWSVHDKGIGIPKDKWEYIFSPFSQLDSSTTRRFDGTGLGLSICKQLLTLMGGQIWLQSEVGVGSVFYFTTVSKSAPPTDINNNEKIMQIESNVPVESIKIPAENVKKRPLATKPLKILVAEDNLINQKVIAKILDKFNYVPTIVPNGYEAVKEVEKNDYDCIFMDLLMPVMNGIEATKTICSLDWSSKTAGKPTIIAMTASASEEDRLMCYNAGMDYHIAKPVNIEIIKKTLEMLEKGKQKHLRTLDSLKT